MAICYEHNDVKILQTSDWTLAATVTTVHSKVYEIDFSEDSSMLLTCGDDKAFRLWSTSTWTALPGGNYDTGNKIFSCKFTSDNSIVLGQEGGEVEFVSSADYTSTVSTIDYGNNVEEVSVRYGTNTYIIADRNNRAYTSLSTT